MLDGVSFPSRPAYYDGLAPPPQAEPESNIHSYMHALNSSMTSHLDGMGLESDSDDDGMGYEYEEADESSEVEAEP